MRKSWQRMLVVVSGLVALLLAGGPLYGQAFPGRPIEFVVPFGAGGGSDILARTIARIMGDERMLPQPLVVVNKPGGGGAVGWSHVLRKRGDPHVLTTVSGSFWTTPLVGGAPFTPRDFTPVAGLARDAFLFAVRADSTYRSIADIVTVSRRSPGLISVSGSAAHSDDRVVTAMLERATGITMTYVPFGGSGPALVAMLGGHVSATWLNPAEGLEQLEARKIRALAVAAPARIRTLPGVPTFRELGMDVVWDMHRGVAMAPGVPADAINTMWAAFQRLCRSEQWTRGYIEANVLEPACQGPEEWRRTIDAVNERYVDVFTRLGLIRR
jgi:putative tricarboxylic transport membrane protein